MKYLLIYLVTGTRRCDHITPVLRQLHWLSVRLRVDYKVACLVHQPLAGQTPAYLADDVRLVRDTDRHPLRSAAVRTCFVPRTRNSFGDRSFGAAGPRVWNTLPPHLRQDMNFARFQHKLKIFLFGNQATKSHRDCCYYAPQKYSYLLTYLCLHLQRRKKTRQSDRDVMKDQQKKVIHFTVGAAVNRTIKQKYKEIKKE